MQATKVPRRYLRERKELRVIIISWLFLFTVTCFVVEITSFSSTVSLRNVVFGSAKCGYSIRKWKLTSRLSYPNSQEEIKFEQDPVPEKKVHLRNIPKLLVRIYADYASRLWKETNNENRQRIANDQIVTAILKVQKLMMKSAATTSIAVDDDDVVSKLPETSRLNLHNACEEVLSAIQIGRNGKMITSLQGNNGGNSTDCLYGDLSSIQSKSGKSSTTVTATQSNNECNGKSIGLIEEISVIHHNGKKSVHSIPAYLDHNQMSLNGVDLEIKPNEPHIQTSFLTTLSKDETTLSELASAPTKKSRRSIAFGAVMGMVVACWVFSGNYVFTGLFTLMTVLGQLEYYRMIMNTGIYPARRISVAGACSMFLAALLLPDLHQICLPMFGLWTMIWFLTSKRHMATINEIATTFTGMFYLGYVPSFWVRIRLIGMDREPTRLAPIVGPILAFIGNTAETSTIIPNWIPQAIHLPITTGAIFIFWTWLCIAFSDVGAYFIGKNFGKTKLGVFSPVAGLTSPNKSIEGVIGGCTISALLAIVGAWIQRWPYPILTGAVHGTLLGILGLIGDLTASMLKRDAGLKDFGDLLPEHGGIMDRVDSFIWAAPYSWLVCAYIIPSLKKFTT